jgi:anti-sigma factor RsiW
MTISDDILMAYLDNELAPDERARVDAALGTNSELRDRLQQQEVVRRALTAAFGPVVNERLPDHLLQTAMSAPISWRWRLRQSLSQFSFSASGGQTPPFARFASGAAVLLVGVAIGWIATRAIATGAPTARRKNLTSPLEETTEPLRLGEETEQSVANQME